MAHYEERGGKILGGPHMRQRRVKEDNLNPVEHRARGGKEVA